MIKIIDDWVLVADENNYVIARYTGDSVDKKGRVTKMLSNKGYYTTLDAAFKGLRAKMELRVLSGDFDCIMEGLNAVMETNKRIEKEFARITAALEKGGKG